MVSSQNKLSSRKKVLVIGYGNICRLDDGLGPCLVAQLEKERIPNTDIESCLMIHVEHADQISRYDVVVFVDADVSCVEPFYFQEVKSQANTTYSSHHLSPAVVCGLTRTLYKEDVRGFVLGNSWV